MNLKKSFSRCALATAILAAVAMPVVTEANFIGAYDVSNWTLQNMNADGNVNTSGAPNSIVLTGGNNGSGLAGTTSFTIAAVATGMVGFNWSYSSLDDPGFDAAQFLLNGVPTVLSDTTGSSGIFSTAVNQGDVFGFRVFTSDNGGGPGVLTISNFNGPTGNGVPDTGGTAILFGLGLVSLLIVQLRLRSQNWSVTT